MLTLDYVFAPRTAAESTAQAGSILAAIAFGFDAGVSSKPGADPLSAAHSSVPHSAATHSVGTNAAVAVDSAAVAAADSADLSIAAPVLAPMGVEPLLERWLTQAAVAVVRKGALTLRYDDEILFGCIRLDAADAADLDANTAVAYREIFAALDAGGFVHPWRIWNFIPRINAEAAGLERYRRFNVARQEAFAAAGRAALDAVPAASAVGCGGDDLAIYFVAGRVPPLPVENPRQISAYRYPAEYGPRSPLFARACLTPYAAGELLFISGTASIVGHRTLHAGDVRAQTRESLANIDAVLGAANGRTRAQPFERRDLAYKVYVRHAADLAAIREELEVWLPDAGAIYIQADICRADLLVEVEASGGHRRAESFA